MLLAVACGGKFYRLPPDKENTSCLVAVADANNSTHLHFGDVFEKRVC